MFYVNFTNIVNDKYLYGALFIVKRGTSMHIPDGYLDSTWSIATYIVSATYIGYAIKKAEITKNLERLSLLTVLAAGIFAAQMLNWPLPGGTSLHFVGGALAGILLGPLFGSLTLALVVTIQCLVFHDGGITALGANILNMAIIDVLVGYTMYKIVLKALGPSTKTRFIGGFIGGWLGITLAGIACGVEIGLSPSFPYGVYVTVPVMGLWHLALGVIEGIITGMVVSYLSTKNPDIIFSER